MELNLKGSHTPALYDQVDDPVISLFQWYLLKVGPSKKPYVFTRIQGRTLSMHRLLMATPAKGLEVDHVNGNGLDNRRDNLRVCTISQNRQNGPGWAKRKCQYKGVSKIKRATGNKGGRPWEARLCWEGKQRVVGYFKDPLSAAHAYDEAARTYHGRYACLNFPKPGERGIR